MSFEERLAQSHANVEQARKERAAEQGSRGIATTDPSSGSLSEDEERARSERPR